MDVSLLLNIILIIGGFAALIKGADTLIDGASNLALRIGVSELLIGLTIVAFGTSLPELVVSILAVIEGDPDLAIGNIVGSNIANIFLVLGIGAWLHKLKVERVTVWREILFAAAAGVLLMVLTADQFIGQSQFNGLDAIDGVVLLTMFALFLYYSFGRNRISISPPDDDEDQPSITLASSLMLILGGIVGLGLGGQLIVTGAQNAAVVLGIADGIIGLTILALGTSAPELAATISAVRQRKSDIAIGAIVGSNLFNTLWVLGLAAMIAPLPFTTSQQLISVATAALAGFLLFIMVAFGKGKHVIGRPTSALFLTLFFVYYLYLSTNLTGL